MLKHTKRVKIKRRRKVTPKTRKSLTGGSEYTQFPNTSTNQYDRSPGHVENIANSVAASAKTTAASATTSVLNIFKSATTKAKAAVAGIKETAQSTPDTNPLWRRFHNVFGKPDDHSGGFRKSRKRKLRGKKKSLHKQKLTYKL